MRAGRIAPAHMLVITQSWPDGFDLSTGLCPCGARLPVVPTEGAQGNSLLEG